MKNVYLIGMMGSGKTVTARALAGLLRMNFCDLDEEMVAENRLSVNEIFQKKGEPFFRSEEKRILKRVARQSDMAVATGGGIVLDPGNVDDMNASGRIIYLRTSPETLWERVKEKKDRPLLQVADPKAMFLRLLGERRPLYESASKGCWVETDGLTAEAVARKIVGKYFP